MEKKLLSILTSILSVGIIAQNIPAYDKDGKLHNYKAEYVEISNYSRTNLEGSANISTVLGPVYTIVSTEINRAIEENQRKMVAKYSGKFSGSVLLNYITVKRYLINSLNKEERVLANLADFSIGGDISNRLVLRLDSLKLYFSKAKYVSSNDDLSFNYHFKIKIVENNEPKTIETDLLIPLVNFNGFKKSAALLNPEVVLDYSPSAEPAKIADIEVEVTEQNISRLKPKYINEFFKNNSESIQQVLKNWLIKKEE